MKKLLFLISVLLLMGPVSGQSIKKGSVVSIFTMTITLQEDVTMNQFLQFFESKFLPELEKTFSCETHLVRGMNREIKDQLGIIWRYDSKKKFNTYWNDDGSPTESGQAGIDSLKPVIDELEEFGTFSRTVNDWLVL